jgi:signal peptidase I
MGNIIFLILVLISFAGLYKIFEKAGLPAWKALIPVYNFWVLGTIINRPKWWGLIMIVPGVNLIMYGVYGFHLARAFKKRMDKDLWMAALMPYLYFAYLGFSKDIKYFGVTDIKSESSFIKNWADPIIFAVVAASIIRGFFFEAFTIPTSSLEKSLMVGDFLFVNKLCYGAKVPETPLSFPFAHNTLPFTESTKSYLEWIKIPHMRLPGYSKPKNGEIVVFNYPDGDTIITKYASHSYYNIMRNQIEQEREADIKINKTDKGYNYYHHKVWNEFNGPQKPFGSVVSRPIDKRDHYVKRCVGIAGDKLEIKDGVVFINDKMQETPEHAQHHYFVKAKQPVFSINVLDDMDIYVDEAHIVSNYKGDYGDTLLLYSTLDGTPVNVDKAFAKTYFNTLRSDTILYNINLTKEKAERVKTMPGVISVVKENKPKDYYDYSIFPHDPKYKWNNDNFGPITLPSKGMTVKIDTGNISIYERMLTTYDDGIHQVQKQGAQVLYDGKPITSYTFKQGYYWLMGDNRHNSADSRSWGVVPFDHVVGRPVFVWFSMKDPTKNPISGKSVLGSLTKNSHDGKFRWERFMCYVGEDGLVSWKIPVALIVLLAIGYNYWKKRRDKEKKPAQKTR